MNLCYECEIKPSILMITQLSFPPFPYKFSHSTQVHFHHNSVIKSSSVSAAAIATITLILLLLQAPASEAAISCSSVINDLSRKPPAACCNGAKTLASAATSTADKQAVCKCIKSASKTVTLNTQLAQALPGNCRITRLGFLAKHELLPDYLKLKDCPWRVGIN